MYHIAVILTDARRKILWVNEDFTKITGYSFDEAVGKSPGAILQGPASEADVIERIRKGLDSMTSLKESITNYRKSGKPYLCKLVIHPVFDDANQLVNFIAFEVDGDQVEHEEQIPMLRLDKKYQSSSLRGLEEMRLYGRLKHLLEEEELFLDPNLSLKSLADRLDTNTKYLSQVVNHCSGQNFQQFINAYRVAEVKSKLEANEHEHLTLYGLAQQCGFKNKSTFYKVFKDQTGHTPKTFLQDEPPPPLADQV